MPLQDFLLYQTTFLTLLSNVAALVLRLLATLPALDLILSLLLTGLIGSLPSSLGISASPAELVENTLLLRFLDIEPILAAFVILLSLLGDLARLIFLDGARDLLVDATFVTAPRGEVLKFPLADRLAELYVLALVICINSGVLPSASS